MPAVDLARIAELARQISLDISPRGVTPRIDGELEELLDRLRPADADAVADRLEAAADPLEALVLGGALARLGTPQAQARLDAYAARLDAADPWPGGFPGRREVLLHLGRRTETDGTE